jgi:hypothetical protein
MLNNRSDTKLVQLLVAGTHDAHERHLRAVLPVVMSVALRIASNSGKTKMSCRSFLQTQSFPAPNGVAESGPKALGAKSMLWPLRNSKPISGTLISQKSSLGASLPR